MHKNGYPQNNPIDLVELCYQLFRKWWLIAICALLGAIVALTGSKYLMTPKYQSTAVLYTLGQKSSFSMVDLQLSNAISADFMIIAKSKPVLDAVVEEMSEEGVLITRGELAGMLVITNPSNTRILNISVTNNNPKHAALIANSVAKQAAKHLADIMKIERPSFVEQAEPSNVIISPSYSRMTMMGFLGGAFIVCAIITVLYLMNVNIKTAEDVERYLDVPVLGTIPYEKLK